MSNVGILWKWNGTEYGGEYMGTEENQNDKKSNSSKGIRIGLQIFGSEESKKTEKKVSRTGRIKRGKPTGNPPE